MDTGLEKSSSAQPWVGSLLKVPVASTLPVELHKVPVCVPVLSDTLKNRMPLMVPLLVAVNLTPSSIPELWSVTSVTLDGATSGQIAHGHLPATSNALLVMYVYVYVYDDII